MGQTTRKSYFPFPHKKISQRARWPDYLYIYFGMNRFSFFFSFCMFLCCSIHTALFSAVREHYGSSSITVRSMKTLRTWMLEVYTKSFLFQFYFHLQLWQWYEMQGKIWSSCWYIICSLSTLYICSLVWSSYSKWCCLHCLNLGHSMLSVSLLQTSVSTLLESSIGHSCIWIVLFTISSLHQNMIALALFLRGKMFFI